MRRWEVWCDVVSFLQVVQPAGPSTRLSPGEGQARNPRRYTCENTPEQEPEKIFNFRDLDVICHTAARETQGHLLSAACPPHPLANQIKIKQQQLRWLAPQHHSWLADCGPQGSCWCSTNKKVAEDISWRETLSVPVLDKSWQFCFGNPQKKQSWNL